MNVPIDSLPVQTAEERFGYSVFQAVNIAAHARLEVTGATGAPPRVASILRALVRVNDGAAQPSLMNIDQYYIQHELTLYGASGSTITIVTDHTDRPDI